VKSTISVVGMPIAILKGMNMMTRKDYERAARRIFALEESRVREERLFLARFLCNFFSSDNPRFDAEKFMKACNLE